jgi:hypothetical protein
MKTHMTRNKTFTALVEIYTDDFSECFTENAEVSLPINSSRLTVLDAFESLYRQKALSNPNWDELTIMPDEGTLMLRINFAEEE